MAMKKQLLIIITLAVLKFKPVTCVPDATLATLPTLLNGSICPTAVQMTCITSDLTSLRWFIDNMSLYAYVYSPDDESRLPITLSTSPGLDIIITSVAPNNVNRDLFDATSTLTTNTTLLQAFNMQDFTCGTNVIRSEPVTVNFNILGPPLTSIVTCSLSTSDGGLDVSLQWSSSFNSQHAVERYRVSVDPDPSPSCSSDQVIPSEDYSCPGLSPERNYSITVSVINCGDQEGESDTFTLLPQLLVVNYTLILEDSAGEVVEERVVNSDSSCSNGNCSSSFSPSGQICRVSIIANNTFGESNPAIAIIVPERLTNCNQILLVMGIILLCVAIGGVAIGVCLIIKIKGAHIYKLLSLVIMLVVGDFMMVVSVVLWVAVGFQVGLQDNTCDSTWQLTRNNLIISAFVFSLLCTISILTFTAFAAVILRCDCKNSYKFKTEGGKIKSKELAKSYASKKLSSHDLPLCVTMTRYAERRNPPPEQMATWFPMDRKWPIEDLSEDIKLKVYFMNKCPSEWKYNREKISHEVIMTMLQESWSGCFVLVKKLKRNPQIRVEFQGQSDGNWSAIGCEAKLIDPPKPTIVLNFNGMSDDATKANVLHQFGHSLGLGHALMKPMVWKVLKPYVHIDSMMTSYCVSNVKDLKVLWTGKMLKQSVVNYDEESVMGYSFNPEWQKADFSTVPDDVKNLTLHKRQTELSIRDRSILKVIRLAPPRYEFDHDSTIAVANMSITIGFTVTSEHPMPSNPEHTIIREDGGTVRCKIKGHSIIFTRLNVSDSGKYIISCCNVNKSEGKETFELKVRPAIDFEYSSRRYHE